MLAGCLPFLGAAILLDPVADPEGACSETSCSRELALAVASSSVVSSGRLPCSRRRSGMTLFRVESLRARTPVAPRRMTYALLSDALIGGTGSRARCEEARLALAYFA